MSASHQPSEGSPFNKSDEPSLLEAPDDVLLRIFRRVPDTNLLGVCRRFRAVIHAYATTVKLVRSYDGDDVDSVHVAAMARCPRLRRVDASGLSEDALPWPLAALTQFTSLDVTPAWHAAAVPPSLPELRVRGFDQTEISFAAGSGLRELLAGLREASCRVVLEKLLCDAEDTTEQLSAPWMRSRVAVSEILDGSSVFPRAIHVLAPIFSRLVGLHLNPEGARDLRDYQACSLPSLTALSISSGSLETLDGLQASRLTGLEKLAVSCDRLTTLRHISRVVSLRELSLMACTCLVDFGIPPPGLSRLTSLVLSNVPALRGLGWGREGPRQLRRVELDAGLSRAFRRNLAQELSHLHGVMHEGLEDAYRTLPFPGGLLQRELSFCTLHLAPAGSRLPSVPLPLLGVSDSSLQAPPRDLQNPNAEMLALCTSRLTGLASLAAVWRCSALERAFIHRCGALVGLDALSQATSLTKLELLHCTALTSLRGCERLRELSITSCTAVRLLDAPAALTRLTKLEVERDCDLSAADGPRWVSLQTVSVSNHRRPTSLEFLSGASQLTSLRLVCMRGVTSLRGLEGACSLRDVSISQCDLPDGLAPLDTLPHLTKLELHTYHGSLVGLSGATRLAVLHLNDLTRPLPSLSSLSGLVGLRRLTCESCQWLGGLGGADCLTRLDTLTLDGWSSLASVAPLCGVTSLKRLTLRNVSPLSSLDVLAGVPHFASVDIVVGGCPDLEAPQGLRVRYEDEPEVLDYDDWDSDVDGGSDDFEEL